MHKDYEKQLEVRREDSSLAKQLAERRILLQKSFSYRSLQVTEYVLRENKTNTAEFTLLWVRDSRFEVEIDSRGIHYPLFTKRFVDESLKDAGPGILFQTGPACDARSAVEAAFVDFYKDDIK